MGRSFCMTSFPIALAIHSVMLLPCIVIALGWLLPCVSCEILRPQAIIPWSEYQKRLREQVEAEVRQEADLESNPFLKNSLIPATEGQLKPLPDSLMKSLQTPIDDSDFIGGIPSYSTASVNNKLMPTLRKTRPSGHSVIRPQLRSRRPDDPRSFIKSKVPKAIDPPHYNAPNSKPPFAMIDAHPRHLPNGAINAIESQGNVSPSSSGFAARKREPEPAQNIRPLQFSSNTLGGQLSTDSVSSSLFDGAPSPVVKAIAPAYTRLGPAPGLILSPDGNSHSNLVNSIFTQSQAHGVVQEIPMGGIPNGVSSLSIPNPPPSVGIPSNPLMEGLPNLFQSNSPISNGFIPAETGNGIVAGGVRNPLEGLLAQGSPLDSFSKLAKNFLGGSNGGGGQGNILDAMTSALSNVGRQGNGVGTAAMVDPPIVEAPRRAEPSLMEKLFSSAANALNESMKAKERQDKFDAIKKQQEEEMEKKKDDEDKDSHKQVKMSKVVQSSLKLPEIENLPEEQRSLLEAAFKSGEIDLDALTPAFKTLVKDDLKEDSQKEKMSRLIEWIQANRPSRTNVSSISTGDKLPYYGKYCGSLASQDGPTKRMVKPSGAIWAVDKDRFIVSKFHFQPASLNDNVTFWLGPNRTTVDLVADSFPSENGFYLQPEPIDINVFVVADLKSISARIRGSESVKSSIIHPVSLFSPNTLRVRRDAIVHVERDEMPPSEEEVKKEKEDIRLVVAGGAVKVTEDSDLRSIGNMTGMTLAVNGLPPTDTSLFNRIIPRGFELRPPLTTPEDISAIKPLDWYAGFQPLLLRLPSTRSVKNINWVSLRDHKHQETIASVIMPNGPGFTIPSMTQLRPLTPNGLFNISSGHIKVHDYKTIEITDFVLKTEGRALWFMIGRDILPNASGNIAPLYNSSTRSFDCDSLRDYNGETVTIRLPGKKDINDVFWLSVFSIPSTLSYSHIYLPYNEMVIPPDLSGIPTPECIYTP